MSYSSVPASGLVVFTATVFWIQRSYRSTSADATILPKPAVTQAIVFSNIVLRALLIFGLVTIPGMLLAFDAAYDLAIVAFRFGLRAGGVLSVLLLLLGRWRLSREPINW